MDYKPLKEESAVRKKKEMKYSFSYILTTLLFIVFLNFLYYSSFSLHSPTPQFAHRNLTLQELKWKLLDYNYRIKQNIIRSLTSEEFLSEDIPALQSISQNFVLAPPVKLTACMISKSMSTILMNMFCYLFNPTAFKKSNNTIAAGNWETRICQNLNEYKSYDTFQQRTKSSFYNMIAVVRDPLSRFVSGYLDKCVVEKRNCFGCEIEDFSCVLIRLEKLLKGKPGVLQYGQRQYVRETVHMAPQTWYCEMADSFQNMFFIKFGTGTDHDRMVKDITIALNIAKVPLEHIDYIERELNRKTRAAHSTEDSDMKSVVTDGILSSKKLRRIFWNIFKNDYRIFEFEPPK